jgi:hypothetical protein
MLPGERVELDKRREAEQAALEERQRAYSRSKSRLNAKHRAMLLKPNQECESCHATPPARELQMDHIIPALDYVRAGHPLEASYAPENLWFLCRPCHTAKTQGPLAFPPTLEYLQKTAWAAMMTPDEMNVQYSQWHANVLERQRRLRLLDAALAGKNRTAVPSPLA